MALSLTYGGKMRTADAPIINLERAIKNEQFEHDKNNGAIVKQLDSSTSLEFKPHPEIVR